MCGRLAYTLPPERIREIFLMLATGASNRAPSRNVAPTQTALVVRRHSKTGRRRLDALS